MAAEAVARIKGAAVQDFLSWYARQFGDARMVHIWERLPDAVRGELGSSYTKLLAFHWYTVPAIHALLEQALDGHDAVEREQLAREGARVIISQTLRGLYRTIFKTLVSPARYLRNANTIWKAFHDTGRVEVQELGPCHHRSELYGWHGFHPFIQRLNGFAVKEIYEAMGCRAVSFEQTHALDEQGEPMYVTEVRWQG
jgi:hypothetical protein